MLTSSIFIGVSLVLLFAGAESLVRGSASLAVRAGLSALVIGLTIVAFGTSSPELVVSLQSVFAGKGDIAVGNIVGSNSFNIGVILGLAALVCPIPVHRQVIKLDAPLALGVAGLLPVLMWDGWIGRAEGLLLVVGITAYVALNVKLARKETSAGVPDAEVALGASVTRHWLVDLLSIAGGLVLLVIGSRLLVHHAVVLAHRFGVSEAVIGLTIVAAGTSMPELATSLVAAFRQQPDIAIGNVVGSNIFNILGILGVSSLCVPVRSPGISVVDVGFMIAFSLLLVPLLYTGRILHRLEGLSLLAVYALYLYLLWPA